MQYPNFREYSAPVQEALFRHNRATQEMQRQKNAFKPEQCVKRLLEYGRGNTTEKLSRKDLDEIFKRIKSWSIHAKITSCIELYAPFKVVGMVQGHFKDLVKIFDLYGHPDRVNYLFLGGYVNRGQQSIQTLCMLLLYKLIRPSSVHLLRGCDESEKMTKIYGFYEECQQNYGLDVWKEFCEVFKLFPYAAIIEGKILCVHGGLSPSVIELKDLKKLQMDDKKQNTGIECDLLWSDPQINVQGCFQKNPRGFSYVFGRDAVEKFLFVNELDMIVRSHQPVQRGFEFIFDGKLLTLCSAPNYIGKMQNAAAILMIQENLECSIQAYRKPKQIKNTENDT